MTKAILVVAANLLLAPISASAQMCPSCIQNSAAVQNAQANVGTWTVRGTLVASTVTATNVNATNLNITNLTGNGAALTALNASQLVSGTVGTALLSGRYLGVTGVGLLSTGTWRGDPVGTQWGGTGKNLANVSAGSLLYFSATGQTSTLLPGQPQQLLQTNGASAPVWVSSPAISGRNIYGLGVGQLGSGVLPFNVTVATNSIPLVNGAAVLGNISGNAASITGILPQAQVATGTWTTSSPASSITVTGVVPGIVGGPAFIPQISIHSDGRVYSSTQVPISLPPAQIAPGPLPGNVTVDPRQVSTGTFPTTAVASSITATGVGPGIYGGPLISPQLTIGSDGRVTHATQYIIPGVSTTTAFIDRDNNWEISQTFRAGSSVTVHADLSAASASFDAVSVNTTTPRGLFSIHENDDQNWVSGLNGPFVQWLAEDDAAVNFVPAGVDGAPLVLNALGGGSVGVGTTAPQALLHVSAPTSPFFTGNIATPFLVGTSSFVVTSNAFVGVGTANPAAKLDVQGGSLNAQYGVTAATASFTGTGAGVFSLATSSGVSVASGVYAGFFVGNGAALTGVTASVSGNLTGPVTSVGNATSIPGPVPQSAVNLSTVALIFADVATSTNALSASTVAIRGLVNTLAVSTTALSGSTVTLRGLIDTLGTSTNTLASQAALVAASTTSLSVSTSSLFGSKASTGTDAGMTAALNLATIRSNLTMTSTATVIGNAFSVGGSTFVVNGGNVIVGSTLTVIGNAFSVGGGTFSIIGSTTVVGGPLYLSTYVYVTAFIEAPSSASATAGANFNLEFSTGEAVDIVMVANTSFTATHPMIGQTMTIHLCQNAIGGWAPTWGSGIDWGTSGNPTITTTANRCDYVIITVTPAGKLNAFLGRQGFIR